MRKFLVAVFVCVSVAAYAQVQSYYQFVDANSAFRAPEVFNCITSSPGLICPGFVQTDVNGNPIGSYNVLPTNAAQWSLGATGSAVPTTATFIAVTSGGNLSGWDRTVRTDPQVGFQINSTTAQSINVAPASSPQWGLGATGAPPPTTAHYLGAGAYTAEPGKATNANMVGLLADLVGKLITQPYAARENFVSGSTSANTLVPSTIIGAKGANVRLFVTGAQFGRFDVGTTPMIVTLNDLANTQILVPNSGGGGGNNVTFEVPLIVPANTALQCTLSDKVYYVTCAAQGHTGY